MSFADSVNATVVAGQAASGAANTGNPIKVAAVYNTTPPAPSNGQIVDAQADSSGNLKVNVVNGAQTGTPGAPTTAVVTVQGVASMTPVQVAQGLTTTGGALYSNAIAPATPAITVVKASAGNIYGIVAFNSTGNELYLKFFDAASATLGTTNCSFQYMIPGNTQGAGFVIPLPIPRSCANKITYAVTGNIATNDNTAITGSAVIVDISYN